MYSMYITVNIYITKILYIYIYIRAAHAVVFWGEGMYLRRTSLEGLLSLILSEPGLLLRLGPANYSSDKAGKWLRNGQLKETSERYNPHRSKKPRI